MGVIRFQSAFLPNLSHVIDPLRSLTKWDVPMNWTTTQQRAFQQTKRLVTVAPVLAFYDPSKPLTGILENNTSEYGIDSAILQDSRPIAYEYASPYLNDTETRWVHI